MSTTFSHHDPTITPSFINELTGRWWVLLLRGVAAIGFGILAFVWPGMTLLTLVFLYGAFALVDGVFAVIGAMVGWVRSTSAWLLVAAGILGIVVGLLTLMWPGAVAVGLVLYVGAWAIVRGVIDVFNAIRLRKEIPNEWSLLISGLLSIVFGCLIFLAPRLGVLAVIWPLAACAVAAGILLVALAFRLHSLETVH
jgi:uncharacterized membrane protein HdeD (DUF308 family)